jgi:hypothetical protein
VPNISGRQLIGKAVGTEQERRRLRKSERMDLDEVRIVGRMSRTSKVSINLTPARVVHGGVFAEPLGVFQFTYRRVVSCDLLHLSVLASANASWMRLSLAPVRRESRVEMMSTAISAARSPAACPPSPSTTRNMPRCASMKKRSSFSGRFRPTSEWPPTNNCDVANMV